MSEAPEPPVKRPFSWRDFFIGFISGIFGTVLLLILAVVAVVSVASRMVGGEDGKDASLSAPAPDLPTSTRLPVFGTADARWTFTTLEGKATSLADFKDKVVVLNFWATWCGPCVMEMPGLERLQTAVAGMPVSIVLVSDENADTIRTFMAKRPKALISYRSTGQLPGLFESDGIPTTFVIARNGHVVVRHIGMARWDHPTVVTFLKSLVN